jgi:hypothetical protein
MVPAAAISLPAQAAIEDYLATGRRELREQVHAFLDWLHSPAGERTTPAEAQRRFTLLRLRFNAVLSQFDIFADVLTQRSEHDTGVWLSGLDVVAADGRPDVAGLLPGSSGDLLFGSRRGGRHPARPHPPAGWWR